MNGSNYLVLRLSYRARPVNLIYVVLPLCCADYEGTIEKHLPPIEADAKQAVATATTLRHGSHFVICSSTD